MRTLLVPRWVLVQPGDVRAGWAVLVDGRRITAVEPLTALEGVDAQRVDLPGHLLVPGLMNLHTHVASGPVSRATAEDFPLPAGSPFYLTLSGLFATANAPEHAERLRDVMAHDLAAMALTGTTLVLDHASTDSVGHLEALRASGLRGYAGPTLPSDVRHRLGTLESGSEVHREYTGATAQQAELAAVEDLLTRFDDPGGRVRVTFGPGGAHTTDPDVIRGCAKLAEQAGVPVTTHLCQAPSELTITAERFGRTPLQHLDDCGLTGVPLIAAHGTYLPAGDLPLAAATGLAIAHCASRKAKEGLTSPSVEFADTGIRTVLGTDAFAADLVGELRMVAVLGKVRTGQVHRPSSQQVLAMATTEAAAALGRDDLGRIVPGALADVVALDLDGSLNAPAADPEQFLVHYAAGTDVRFSMVDGEVLVREGVFTRGHLPTLRARASTAIEEIWADARRRGAWPTS